MTNKTIDPVLRWPAVKAACGLARSTVYLKIARNEFPKPVSLGASAVGWRQSQIAEWLDGRAEVQRAA